MTPNVAAFLRPRSRESLGIDLLGLLLVSNQGVALERLPLLPALASRLGLGTLGIHLLLEGLLTSLLSLGTVDLESIVSICIRG